MRLWIASLLMLIAWPAVLAWAYNDVELELKLKTETSIHEVITKFLTQQGLSTTEYRLVASVTVITPAPDAVQEPETDSDTAGGKKTPKIPPEITIGLINAQKIFENMREKPKKPSIEIDQISVLLALRDDVPEQKRRDIVSGLGKFLDTSFQVKPEVKISVFSDPPVEPPKEPIEKRLAPFANPISALFLVLGLLGVGGLLLLIAKKIPSWSDVNSHSIKLQSLEQKMQQKAAKDAAAALKVENTNSQVNDRIDTSEDFQRSQKLQRKLIAEIKTHFNKDTLSNVLINWNIEGTEGLRKSVLLARAWNQLKPGEALPMKKTPDVVQAFREIAQLGYSSRAELLEKMLFELNGIETLGSEAFGHRLAFVLNKPPEILHFIVGELKESEHRSIFLQMLPEDKRTELLKSLKPDEKFELLASAVTTVAVSDEKIAEVIQLVKSISASAETSAFGGGEASDHLAATVSMIEALSSHENIEFIKNLRNRSPEQIEWLKANTFCLGLFQELKTAVIGKFLNPLPPQELTLLAVALGEAFTQKLLGILPAMKSTIVKDSISKIRSHGEPPDYTPLDSLVERIRNQVRADNRLTPQELYEEAASVESPIKEPIRAAA